MTALLDAVAKAICVADFHDWPKDDYNGRAQQKAYRKMAGAAIAAIIVEGFQIVPKVTE